MRDYGKVSPLFWVGKTGKALRGKPEAQVVAFYLITSPHAEMTGVFYCPVMYIAHETGMTLEGASKALQSLVDIDFCSFDEESDTVFVHEMAKFQIGEELKVNDNQVKSVRKAYSSMKGVIKARFYERYKAAFHLGDTSPSRAPSKQGAGEGTGAETTSVPKGTGGEPPFDPPLGEGLTAQEALFQIAVPWLVDKGANEKNVRSLLGGAAKQLTPEGAWELMQQCMREVPLEPIAWLAGAVNSRIKARASPGGGRVPQKENFDAVDYGQSGRL